MGKEAEKKLMIHSSLTCHCEKKRLEVEGLGFGMGFYFVGMRVGEPAFSRLLREKDRVHNLAVRIFWR